MSDEQNAAEPSGASGGSLAWIPVTERLPSPYSDVLVSWATFKGVPLVDAAKRTDEGWMLCGGREIASSAVKFWMAIPEPPNSEM